MALPESVYTSVSDQKRFIFRLNFFFKKVLVMAFSIFCFGISALDFFYLSDLLECCLTVLVESKGHRIILFLFASLLFSKNPKTFVDHHALHFALCIVLALDLLWSTS